MGVIKPVLLLVVVAFALLASCNAFVSSGESNKSPSASTNTLRGSLKTTNGVEERGASFKKAITFLPVKKTNQLSKLDKIKTAMLNGKMSKYANNPYTSHFLAGKYPKSVAKTMRAAGKSEAEISKVTREYTVWLKSLLKAKLPKTVKPPTYPFA